MKVAIEKLDDWTKIAVIGHVVDPMILRCGELFLRGASGVRDAHEAWSLMTMNIHAIGMFFDRLILDEKIPVFNYADTFDMDQNFNDRRLAQVNQEEEILVDVDVRYEAYQRVKDAALAELMKLYDGREAGLDPQEAYNILGELSASGYAWYPQLGHLALSNNDEKRLAAYILGGLIFGAYAQLTGTDHLMQPKRSRLFLAISLKQKTSRLLEEHLFEKLGELTGRPTAEVPYTPTFFPLLLSQSVGPVKLLTNALKLRKSSEVRDYRAWLHDALTDFNKDGRISTERAREVKRIESAIRQKLEGLPSPQVEIKMTVTEPLELKADVTPQVRAAWGWLIGQLPGKRHRKLLTRAIIADREYVKLDTRVQTVWNAS